MWVSISHCGGCFGGTSSSVVLFRTQAKNNLVASMAYSLRLYTFVVSPIVQVSMSLPRLDISWALFQKR
jgi:hypothetical protein